MHGTGVTATAKKNLAHGVKIMDRAKINDPTTVQTVPGMDLVVEPTLANPWSSTLVAFAVQDTE